MHELPSAAGRGLVAAGCRLRTLLGGVRLRVSRVLLRVALGLLSLADFLLRGALGGTHGVELGEELTALGRVLVLAEHLVLGGNHLAEVKSRCPRVAV